MKKEDLISVGISEEVSAFLTSEERKGRVLNREGLELGDEITIKGIQSTLGEFNGNKYVVVETTGAASTISLSRLVGTKKVKKYFNPERGDDLVSLAKDFNPEKVLSINSVEEEAAKEVAEMIGKTLRVVGIATECGQFDQTFMAFAEV